MSGAGPPPPPRETDDPLDALRRWPQPAAAGVADARGVRALAGEVDAALPWASVTEMVTALAVLGAVGDGLLHLDQPAGPPGATLRHLLAHAAGLELDGDRVLSPPGRRRIYSNRGIELAAEALEAAAGRPVALELRDRVLGPLGMERTDLAGSPASGLRGPVVDLLRLGRELLAPRSLEPATVALASTVAFPGLVGVLPGYGRQDPNDWGLGFELRDSKHPHWTGSANSPATFGHFGRSGSFLWVDPAAGLACAGLAGADFDLWAIRSWPVLADAVLRSFAPGRPPT